MPVSVFIFLILFFAVCYLVMKVDHHYQGINSEAERERERAQRLDQKLDGVSAGEHRGTHSIIEASRIFESKIGKDANFQIEYFEDYHRPMDESREWNELDPMYTCYFWTGDSFSKPKKMYKFQARRSVFYEAMKLISEGA